MRGLFTSLVAVVALCFAQAQTVYVTSSGNATADTNLMNALTSQGLTPTLGVQAQQIDATTNLAPFRVVYFQPNYNWSTGVTTEATRARLVSFVGSGGGLVTTEWTVWHLGLNNTTAFGNLMPGNYGGFNSTASVQYSLTTIDPIMSNGLPSSFTLSVDSISGTQTHLTAKAGATTFFTSDYVVNSVNGAGAVGWDVGGGRVMNLSTVMSASVISNANGALLAGNAIRWAAVPEPMTLSILALGVLAKLRRRKKQAK